MCSVRNSAHKSLHFLCTFFICGLIAMTCDDVGGGGRRVKLTGPSQSPRTKRDVNHWWLSPRMDQLWRGWHSEVYPKVYPKYTPKYTPKPLQKETAHLGPVTARAKYVKTCNLIWTLILFGFDWFCLNFIDFVWIWLYFDWFCLHLIDFVWILLILFGFNWFCPDLIDFVLILIALFGFDWFCLDLIDFVWIQLFLSGFD